MEDASEMTVLVVDDEPSNIDLIKGILPGGFKVKAATRGAVALKIAQKAPPPDIILLDVMMPEMDGYEVCRQIKANPDTTGIQIVFISGHVDEAEKQKALGLGAVGFLSKPVSPDELHALLKQLTSSI